MTVAAHAVRLPPSRDVIMVEKDRGKELGPKSSSHKSTAALF